MLKKALKTIGYFIFLAITVLLLLELSYRFYAIDFYKGHLMGLNDSKTLSTTDQASILVIGDSFTADRSSYVSHLRDSLRNYRIINSGIPGTSLPQHRLMISSRMKRFRPDVLLYQIYVGNDLLEFHHPTESDGISSIRKCYWWLSDRFLVLSYINARLPQLRQAIYHDLPVDIDSKKQEIFSVQQYSHRAKMQFNAEPFLLENCVQLKRNRQKDMIKYTKQLKKMLSHHAKNCKVIILVMPHCSQINQRYATNMELIGAQFSEITAMNAINYPFINYLKVHFANQDIQVLNTLYTIH